MFTGYASDQLSLKRALSVDLISAAHQSSDAKREHVTDNDRGVESLKHKLASRSSRI